MDLLKIQRKDAHLPWRALPGMTQRKFH